MKTKLIILSIMALCLSAAPANADFILRITDLDTSTILTIPDNSSDDIKDLVDGQIVYSGTVGEWDISVSAGITKPYTSDLPPYIDLNSLIASSASVDGASLLLELTETGFVLPSGGDEAVLLSEIGGTTVGTLWFTQYMDRDNNEFRYDDYAVAQGPFGPGAFSGTKSLATPVTDGMEFSITEVVQIEHGNSNDYIATSFDASSTVVPVPGAVLLGILGLSAAGIKLRRFA